MATLKFVMKNKNKQRTAWKTRLWINFSPRGTQLQTLMLQGNIKISMTETYNAYRNFGLCMWTGTKGSAYLRLSRMYILQIWPTVSWKLYHWTIICQWMTWNFGAHSIIVLFWVIAQRVARFSATSQRKPEITHSKSVFLFPSSDILSGLSIWSSPWTYSQGISRWNNF